MVSRLRVCWLLVTFCALVGCESATHQNIDKWRGTVQGEGKLAAALQDAKLSADHRAHAAQVLFSLEKGVDAALTILDELPETDRAAVMTPLVGRLWETAALPDRLTQPTGKNVAAKDALFDLRKYATGPALTKLEGYLIDWLTGYYVRRAPLGRHHGSKILRVIGGKRASPKLIAAAKRVVDDPGRGSKILVLSDELLKGIAFTGTPESVEFLFALAMVKHTDPDLQARGLGAIYHAYVLNIEPPLLERTALQPLLGRLEAVASAGLDKQPGANINVAFDLLAAIGAPDCLPPLVRLAQHPAKDRRWRAVQYGIRCAGAKGVVQLAEALPQKIGYQKGIIEKYFWDAAVEVGPDVAAPARKLLKSKSWVARMSGIQMLARVGSRKDAKLLRLLKRDKASAKGWWGPRPKNKRKPEPKLGQLALDAAKKLEQK